MARFTVELDGGGHFEVDATSVRDARRRASRMPYVTGRDIIEIRPFAAKPRDERAVPMPLITVKPSPFDVLKSLLP